MPAAIFDLDGTLADTSADLIAAANAALAGLGIAPLDPKADKATAFLGGRAMLRLGMGRAGGVDEAVVDAGYPVLLEHYGAHICDETRLYDGCEAALDALSAAGWTLGVCTNKPEGLALSLLEKLGILNRFAAMLGADTLPVRKPDARHLTETIARCGGGPAFLLGDTMTDMRAAHNARTPCILVDFGAFPQDLEGFSPAAVMTHFDQLTDLAARVTSAAGPV